MDDLMHNQAPRCTQQVVRRGLLSAPFVLVDVGIQGGIHPRWNHLGSALRVYGFDALDEVLEPLRRQNCAGRDYYAMVLGDRDEERKFFVAKELTQSSLSPSEHAQQRTVPGHRLDTLVAEGLIAQPDFIKVDVEGHEPEVLRGAGKLLDKVIGIEAETTFNRSPQLAKGHLAALVDHLAPHGLFLYDLAISRSPRPSFRARATELGIRNPASQSPGTLNALFCREVTTNEEAALKRAIILEIYSVTDFAYEGLRDTMPALADLVIQKRTLWNTPAATVRRALADLGISLCRSAAFRLRK